MMRFSSFFLCFFLLLGCFGAISLSFDETFREPSKDGELLDLVKKLFYKIQDSQVPETTSYIPPFISEQKLKGLYPSYIHVNFHGNEIMTLLRHEFKFFDNNMFSTNWITQVLLEFSRLDFSDLQVSKKQVLEAITRLLEFQDKNRKEDVPVYCFWKQELQNGTWTSWPTNIAQPLKEMEDFGTFVEEALKAVGLGFLAKDVDWLIDNGPEFLLQAFIIPADTDDSSCNLALGSFLKEFKDEFSDSYEAWNKQKKDMEEFSNLYQKYAYRPFSDNLNENLIDPRTYFWLRGFLDQEYENAQNKTEKPDVAFVTTWLENISEDRKTYKHVQMPFSCNNVDASVAANTIFGISKAVLTSDSDDYKKWFTPGLQKVYSDTARLISWGIESGMIKSRQDLALLYYPPLYDFFWFVSRSVLLLNSASNVPEELHVARDSLTKAIRTYGTWQLLNSSQTDTKNDWVFWDDFVGDNDTNLFGQQVNRGEDRIFSTAVAVNALIDSWSLKDEVTGKQKWIPTVPKQVLSTVQKAVNFLKTNIFSGKYLTENAFFSGSMKGTSTLPFKYPANFRQYINGTDLPPDPSPSSINSKLINAVSGYIPKQKYDEMLKGKPFGYDIPLSFHSFNKEGDIFPYWSSPIFTDTMVMYCFAKYHFLTL